MRDPDVARCSCIGRVLAECLNAPRQAFQLGLEIELTFGLRACPTLYRGSRGTDAELGARVAGCDGPSVRDDVRGCVRHRACRLLLEVDRAAVLREP